MANEFDITAKITNLDAIKKALQDIKVNVKIESPELTKLLGFAGTGINIRVNLQFGPQLQQLLDLARDGFDLRPRGGNPGGNNNNPGNNTLSRGSALVATRRLGGDEGRFAGATGDLANLSQNLSVAGDKASVKLLQLDRVLTQNIERALALENKNAQYLATGAYSSISNKGQDLQAKQAALIAKIQADAEKEANKSLKLIAQGAFSPIGSKGEEFQAKTAKAAQVEADRNAKFIAQQAFSPIGPKPSGPTKPPDPEFTKTFFTQSARGQAFFDREKAKSEAEKAKQEAEDNLFAKYRATGAFSKITPGGGAAPGKEKNPLDLLNISATLYNFRLVKEAIETLVAPLKEASEAAYAFERSAVGIGATLSAQTIRVRDGKALDDVESSRLNLAQGFKTQDVLRKSLAPLGVSSEIGNAIGQGLTQGFAGTKGFNEDFVSKTGARIAAFTAIADAPLLTQSTRFFKDFSDITNQTQQAKNTQLGARLSKVAPEIFTAQTAEEFEKASQVLEKYVTALKTSNTALQANLEVQGAIKNAYIDLGEAFNTTIAPELKDLATALENDGVSSALKQLGTSLGSLGELALFLTAGLVYATGAVGEFNKGIGSVSSIIANELAKLTNGVLGKKFEDQAKDNSELQPNFNKALKAIGAPGGIDLMANAQKEAEKVPDSVLNRISKETIERSANLKPGEDKDVTFEQIGNLRTSEFKSQAAIAVKDQQRLAKSFNTGSAGDNLEHLKANTKALDESVTAQVKAVNAAKFQLDILQRDSGSTPEAIKDATLKVAEAEKVLIERRVEATKGIIAQADAQVKLADALRATIETTTFRGKRQELGQRQTDLNASDRSNNKLFGAGKIDSTELDLRTRENALKRFNAGVEQERLPLNNAITRTNLKFNQLQFQNLDGRQADEKEALVDQGSALKRQLANFKEDENLRRLTREESFGGAAEALGSVGGKLTEDQLPSNISKLGADAAFERAGRALEAFKDKVASSTEALSTFVTRATTRRFDREAAVINAVQAIKAAGGSIQGLDLSGLSKEAYKDATRGVSNFGSTILAVTGSIIAYNTSLQKLTETSNQVYNNLNADAQKPDNNTSAFQIARNKASEEADRAATEAQQTAQADFYKSRFSDTGEVPDATGHASEFVKNRSIDTAKNTIEDLRLGPGQDERQKRAKRADIPGEATTALARQKATENVRVAGRDVVQGPEIDAETQRAIERALRENGRQLQELPLKQLLEALNKLNSILEGKQALGETNATKGGTPTPEKKPTIGKDGKPVGDSGSASGTEGKGSPGGTGLVPPPPPYTPDFLPDARDSVPTGYERDGKFTRGDITDLPPIDQLTRLKPKEDVGEGNLRLGSDLFGAESGVSGSTTSINKRGVGIASDIIKGLTEKAKPSDLTKSRVKPVFGSDNIFNEEGTQKPLSEQEIERGSYNGFSRALRESFS